MNIFEFCERFHISQSKARLMDRAGALRLEGSIKPESEAIRFNLMRGQALTAAQLVELIEAPGALLDLGKYASRAETELASLGRVEPAPMIIAAAVTDAAKNDLESVDALLGWLFTTIPAKPVSHAYIAVRLLLGLAPNIRKYDVPRIPRALLNCRRRPEFATWWRIEARGTRNVTIYQRPTKKALASFDL